MFYENKSLDKIIYTAMEIRKPMLILNIFILIIEFLVSIGAYNNLLIDLVTECGRITRCSLLVDSLNYHNYSLRYYLVYKSLLKR